MRGSLAASGPARPDAGLVTDSVCCYQSLDGGPEIAVVPRERQDMARWSQSRHKLATRHAWKARPGYQIFVAQRGAIRFDVPRDWVVIPEKMSYKLCDRQPP